MSGKSGTVGLPKQPSDFINENVLQIFRGRLIKLQEIKKTFQDFNREVKHNEQWLLRELPQQSDISENIKNKITINWKCLCRSVNLHSYPYTDLIIKIKSLQPLVEQFNDLKTNLNITHLQKLQDLIRPYVKQLLEGPTDVISYQYYLKEFNEDKMNLLNNPTPQEMKDNYFGKMLKAARDLSMEIQKQRQREETMISRKIEQFKKRTNSQSRPAKV